MNSDIIIITISLFCSVLFSGIEIAFNASNELLIEMGKKQGTFLSRLLSHTTSNPARFRAVLWLGNQISIVVFAYFSGRLFYPLHPSSAKDMLLPILGHTLLTGMIFLAIGEALPSSFFRNKPNATLNFFLVPISIFHLILSPLSILLIQLSKKTLFFLFKIKLQDEKTERIFGPIDFDNLASNNKMETNGNEEIEHEVKLVQNALDFADVKLRDFLVPRTEIVATEIKKTIDELQKIFVDSGFSKILIYEGSIDNIIGYVHTLVLFSKPADIQSCILPITVVPETMPADKLLRLFTTQKKSIALVVDEFGGTAGIVTIEDVMEQIFGEIEDEHDTPELIEKEVRPEEFVFSARLEIEYLNEKYELDLPESDDYNTLAGLILSENEDIPKLNQEIKIGDYIFKILKVGTTKIELVRMKQA